MTRQIPLPLALAPHARYETYVSGPNAAALTRLRARTAGESIWLWGGKGVGKTHLLQAACAAESARAMYVPLGAARDRDPAMLEGLAGLHVVAIDDVDAVAGMPAWDRALLELINEHKDVAGRLLFAATGPPTQITCGLPDLDSRLRGSTVFRLQPLDDADLLEALRLQAEARGLELTESAGRYLLARVQREMGGLSAWLERLDEAGLASQRKLTIPLIRETLAQRA